MDGQVGKVKELEGKEMLRWIASTGWHGRCPNCGKGHMFKGWLKLVDRCGVCGLDYSFARPDDGPAFFVLMILTFPLVGFAMWVELAYDPPAWVHFVTSGPLMLITCILSLRPLKGWLVSSQYVNKAQEAGTEELEEELDRNRRALRGQDREASHGPTR